MPSLQSSANEELPNASVARSRPLLKFFLLVFALSIPFWLIGALTGRQLLPGLPVAALMFVCPAAAASILVFRRDKTPGLSALFRRSLDFREHSSISCPQKAGCQNED